ncbi:7192_t:CDS:2, partial [Scutellospora calospora]
YNKIDNIGFVFMFQTKEQRKLMSLAQVHPIVDSEYLIKPDIFIVDNAEEEIKEDLWKLLKTERWNDAETKKYIREIIQK